MKSAIAIAVLVLLSASICIAGTIPQTGWTLKYVDSENVVTGERAVNAFDGNPTTIWHTEYTSNNPAPPHEIQIDLGALYTVSGFLYMPRQDGGANGKIGQYEFYLSPDGENWGTPVALGSFANDSLVKEVTFAGKEGRFVRLVAVSEANGERWTSVAELNVLSELIIGNVHPYGGIESPVADLTIGLGDTVDFRGLAVDPDSSLPVTVLWHFGEGSGVPDSSKEDPGLVRFKAPGTFKITFAVRDASGLSSTPTSSRTVTVLNGPLASLVPDWTFVQTSPFPLIEAAGITSPVLTKDSVTDAVAELVADPFLFKEGNQWFMFFEVFEGYGKIALAKSLDGLHWQYDKIVLDDGINHSFPLVLKYNGKHYLIPESYTENEVAVYESLHFPYGWKRIGALVTGREFVDPSVFRYNGKWWMFVGDTSNENLYLYYSSDLLSGWTEHPKSPLIAGDASKARPGGRSFVFDYGRIIRLAQNDIPIYGVQVRAFQVDVLSETDYQEHEITESPLLAASGNGWNTSGMHHLDCWAEEKWLCVADGHNNYVFSIGGIYTSAWGPINYTITSTAGTGGNITPSGNLTVSHGSSQGFEITPSSGYVVADVKVDGESVGAVTNYAFDSVRSGHTIEAVFAAAKKYTILAVNSSGGTLSPSGIVKVSQGGTQTFAIAPKSGYRIATTIVDLDWVGPVSSYTFSNVAANHSIAALFVTQDSPYLIVATDGSGGSISPSGLVWVKRGSSKTFKITASPGYKIADVKVDGVSKGAIGSFTFTNMTDYHSIRATFKR